MIILTAASAVEAQSAGNQNGVVEDTTILGRQLGSSDAYERQRAAESLARISARAAESLARISAVDQKRLVEGYYLQEKDKKVRLALEWALYRMGKTEALFRIVHDLDSSRHDQAVGYLAQIEGPELLYPFLRREDNPRRITAGLIEALGYAGDGATLELIKPYRDAYEPGVAPAAEAAIQRISERLAQAPPVKPTRPRVVGKDQPQPD